MLRLLTWLISLILHASAALFFLMPASDAALEGGGGQDSMVVEQGIAIEGVVKLGDDAAQIKAVEASPTEAIPVAPPEDIEAAEDVEVISSTNGPEQDQFFDAEPEEISPVPPQPVTEPQPEQVQPVPQQQVAALPQEMAMEQLQSSAKALSGGDTTARSAYLGTLRARLERAKVNPRSRVTGTAIVVFVVDADGRVMSCEVKVSSGHKSLDDAAVASIHKAAPFPPMPKELDQAPIEVSVPFRFSLR